MNNYPSTTVNQIGMVPLGYHNVNAGYGYNYGNSNMMSNTGINPNYDENYLYYQNTANMNSINNTRKNTPFNFN